MKTLVPPVLEKKRGNGRFANIMLWDLVTIAKLKAINFPQDSGWSITSTVMNPLTNKSMIWQDYFGFINEIQLPPQLNHQAVRQLINGVNDKTCENTEDSQVFPLVL